MPEEVNGFDRYQVYEYIYLHPTETFIDEKGKKRPVVMEQGFHSYNQLLQRIQDRLIGGDD